MPFDAKSCQGGWAVVTGASSGIGRAFAQHLAPLRFNLLLVARREVELRALADALERAHDVRAVALALDLAAPEATNAVLTALDRQPGATLRLLVSNAGVGQWGSHDAVLAERYAQIVALNCAATVALTTALLPRLQAAAPAAVVHVSSQAAYQPVPYMAVYAASKAFVHHFSLALHEEQRQHGVLVQTLVPAPTATEFDSKAGAYESGVQKRGQADDVVRASLAALDCGAPVATNAKGLWQQRLFASLAPPSIVLREVAKMFKPAER